MIARRGSGGAKTRWLGLALAVAVGVAGPACDESMLPDPGPSSGIDPQTSLTELTDAEILALCDWIAGRLGGYGRGVTCMEGGTISARQTRALCVMDFENYPPACPFTVADVEQCDNDLVSEPVCEMVPAICSALIACK
jgi:hypothetical protein